MKTAVLFGSSGLIGSNLLDNLINNNTYNKIKIFVRKLPSIYNSKVEVINTDFLDLETLSLVKESGCHYLVYAPESGSQRTWRYHWALL